MNGFDPAKLRMALGEMQMFLAAVEPLLEKVKP